MSTGAGVLVLGGTESPLGVEGELDDMPFLRAVSARSRLDGFAGLDCESPAFTGRRLRTGGVLEAGADNAPPCCAFAEMDGGFIIG